MQCKENIFKFGVEWRKVYGGLNGLNGVEWRIVMDH